MENDRKNQDQEQVTDENVVGKAAEENEEFEDVDDMDDSDQEADDDVDEE
jgi:hypothetical protein